MYQRASATADSIDTARRLSDGAHFPAAIIDLAGGSQTPASSELTVDNDKKRFLNGSENR